jgi:hypothetical protein
MLDMKPPVPRPIMMMETKRAASAPLGCVMTGGMDEMIRTMWPTKAMTRETAMVLNRPHFSSAT